jgi:hypothetical protein
MITRAAVTIISLLFAFNATAEIITEEISYTQGDT